MINAKIENSDLEYRMTVYLAELKRQGKYQSVKDFISEAIDEKLKKAAK
jgi:hypothetical protein